MTKPFDFDAWNSGASAQTRQGDVISQLTYFDTDDDFPFVGIINNEMHFWNRNGTYKYYRTNREMDLVLTPVQRSYWVNCYPNCITIAYETKAEADYCAQRDRKDCIQVCYED
jgi:hypothetical protein